jgi:hypothetical protein
LQIDLKPTGLLVKWIGPDGGWLTGRIMEDRISMSSDWVLVKANYDRGDKLLRHRDLTTYSREDKE